MMERRELENVHVSLVSTAKFASILATATIVEHATHTTTLHAFAEKVSTALSASQNAIATKITALAMWATT